ncbi:exopolyphosphatase-like protein [Candidatus Magnetoovum chiemensis]|nr:exopolyphosphatase-like protein [Candidatus Magnetoovum chiemensis]
MNPPKKIIDLLKEENNFCLATHIFPDGDTLGAALALAEALEIMGKDVIAYNKDKIPTMFDFMPRVNTIKTTIDFNTKEAVLIILDCNSPDRANVDKYTFKTTAVIDHHLTNSNYGDIQWISSSTPSTGMMVYYIIKSLGINLTIDMAVNIYTTLAVDTGTFRYSNTTAESLKVASELVSIGVRPSFISDYLYNNWREPKFLLLKNMLSKMEIQNNIAINTVTLEMFNQTGANKDDTESFVNFPIMVETIKVSALFREIEKNSWKISLRSRGSFNVAEIAEKLGGGGHKNAAGCRIKGDIKSAKNILLEALLY